MRDTSKLEGKCGACEYKEICGGSRARAYAITGDPLAQEPCCIYQPKNWDPHLECQASAFAISSAGQLQIVNRCPAAKNNEAATYEQGLVEG